LGAELGHARTLLIEARLCQDADRTAAIRERILALQPNLPALQNCVLLIRVLGEWECWTTEGAAGTPTDDYWGL
jgi:hypothetical protein